VIKGKPRVNAKVDVTAQHPASKAQKQSTDSE